jgi:hypothetical protein
MTRLSQYIVHDKKQWFKTIIKDCKPMLKLLKKSPKDYLYRGSDRNISGTIKLKNKGNRSPKYISFELHEYLNSELHKMFGWHPRSDGVFTAAWGIAGDYGKNRYIVLPVGNFTYIVHPSIQQLWNHYDHKSYRPIGEMSPYEKEERLRDINSELKNYKDKNLANIIKGSHYECILNCKSYYIVNMSLEPDLRNIIHGI